MIHSVIKWLCPDNDAPNFNGLRYAIKVTATPLPEKQAEEEHGFSPAVKVEIVVHCSCGRDHIIYTEVQKV